MERTVSIVLVSIVFALPEAAATTAHIPVTCIFNEWQNFSHCIRKIVRIHIMGNMLIQLVHTRDHPFIKRVGNIRWRERLCLLRVEFPTINFSVHRKEIIHVPNHTKLTRHITNVLVLKREVFTVKHGTTHK